MRQGVLPRFTECRRSLYRSKALHMEHTRALGAATWLSAPGRGGTHGSQRDTHTHKRNASVCKRRPDVVADAWLRAVHALHATNLLVATSAARADDDTRAKDIQTKSRQRPLPSNRMLSVRQSEHHCAHTHTYAYAPPQPVNSPTRRARHTCAPRRLQHKEGAAAAHERGTARTPGNPPPGTWLAPRRVRTSPL